MNQISRALILGSALPCVLASTLAAEAGKAEAKGKADAESKAALVTVSTSELKPRPVRKIEFIPLKGCPVSAGSKNTGQPKATLTKAASKEKALSNSEGNGSKANKNKAGSCEKKAKQIAAALKDFVDGVEVKAVGAGLLVSVAADVPEELDKTLGATVKELATQVKLPKPPEKKNEYSGYVDLDYIKAADAVKRLKARKFGGLKFDALSDNRIFVNWTVPSSEKDPNKIQAEFRLFRDAVRQLDQPHQSKRNTENPAMRLYRLDATRVANALNETVSDLKVKPVGADQIVISGARPLEEEDVEELKRRIALLDLPQPKVALQVWGFQMSDEDPKKIKEWVGKVQSISNDLNNGIQKAFYEGWLYIGEMVQSQLQSEALEQALLDCVEGPQSPADCANQQRRLAKPDMGEALGTPLYDYVTTRYETTEESTEQEVKPQLRYGLGYGLYANAQPSLGKMLLVLAAAKNPEVHAQGVLDAMRKNPPGCYENQNSAFEYFEYALKYALAKERVPLLQAAIADFFFHYKWSVQYPHDFSPYLFSRSADELETVMSPLIDAFNRDVETCVQNALQRQGSELPKGRKRNPWAAVFFNKKIRTGLAQSGMMRVATLSGSQAKADGTSVSYFDVTAPRPTLSELVANKDAQVSALTAHLEGNPAQALGLLASLAIPEQTVVQVQRGMGIQLTPRALPTGSGAEIDVAIGVGEGDAAPTQIGENSNPHMLDRVANHSVTTKVRVDALKLFEVSTFSNTVHHPQPDGIVPVVGHAWNAVFGAVPGAGRLFKWRRRPAPMHHRSVALISAIVVPTPMDLAVGVRFGYDLEDDPWREKVRRWKPPKGARKFHARYHECLIKPEGLRIQTGKQDEVEGTECQKIELDFDGQDQEDEETSRAASKTPAESLQQAAEARASYVASQ